MVLSVLDVSEFSKISVNSVSLLNMSLLKDRVAEAMARAGVSQAELARRIGITRASVAFWVRGGTKSIEGENLTRAARALGCNPSWLAEGRLPKWTDEALPGADIIQMPRTVRVWPFDAPADLWDDLSPAHRRALNGIVSDYLTRNARKRGDSSKRPSKCAAKAR